MWKALVAAALLLAPASAAAQTPDEGNVATRLLRDIGGDYVHFVSVENAEWLGLGGAAALGMHSADEPISEWVATSNPPEMPGAFEYGSQLLQVPLAAAWWAIAGIAGSERHAAAGRDLLRAQISVVSWSYAIKYATDRTRPNGDPRSFPSGHASTSFATAMVLQQHYGWKAGLPAFLAATYSGVSRVTEHQHWASDVVFGAAVGMVSGRTATIRLRETRVSFAPLAVPGGGGVIVSAMR